MDSNAHPRFAVIGAGISGLSIANMLQENGVVVKVFESDSRPGGLVKCTRAQGSLFHLTGGHVFNSKRRDVLEWFWSRFNQTSDFLPARRNAVISLEDGRCVGYPIENHLCQLDAATRSAVIRDLLEIARSGPCNPGTLGEFFASRFGSTLNRIYFTPYNNKIWGCDVTDLPLEWLEGKLPMPTVQEIFENNIGQVDESKMVHSSFYYPKTGGSQFLADSLAAPLDVRYNCPVGQLRRRRGEAKWEVDGELFDAVVYAGNVKNLPAMLGPQHALQSLAGEIERLGFHGTTSVLCEINANPYSWIYMPSAGHGSHRIICTGNFSPDNNAKGVLTGIVELSRPMDRDEIEDELAKIPFQPRYIAHHWESCTYPVQDRASREMIGRVKSVVEPQKLYLLGRFAEWEYYNMDAAMGACIDFMKERFPCVG